MGLRKETTKSAYGEKWAIKSDIRRAQQVGARKLNNFESTVISTFRAATRKRKKDIQDFNSVSKHGKHKHTHQQIKEDLIVFELSQTF